MSKSTAISERRSRFTNIKTQKGEFREKLEYGYDKVIVVIRDKSSLKEKCQALVTNFAFVRSSSETPWFPVFPGFA